METAMRARTKLHEPPSWTVAARRQHALLFESGRVWLILALGLSSMLTMEYLRGPRGAGPSADMMSDLSRVPSLDQFFMFALLATPLWTLLVWRGERRSARRYHWSMPVDRRQHDLWRVAAGASGLVTALALLAPLGLLFAWIGSTPRLFEYGPVYWINLFTMPLLVYLGTSVLPLVTDRPVELGLGLFVAVAGVTGLVIGIRFFALAETIRIAFGGRYGLIAAVWGGHGHAVEAVRRGMVGYSSRSASDFLIATLLWFSIAIVALIFASGRRP